MLINKTYSRFLVAGLTASVLGITVQALSANQPGIAGKPFSGTLVHSGAGYFNPDGFNSASVEIPIPVTSNKTWALSARIRSNGVDETSCHGVRYGSQNDGHFGTSGTTTSTTYQGVTLGSVTLPTGGGNSLTIVCDLPRTRSGKVAAVESVDFN